MIIYYKCFIKQMNLELEVVQAIYKKNHDFWAYRKVSYRRCGYLPLGYYRFFMYLTNFGHVRQLAVENVDIFDKQYIWIK